MSHYVNNKTLLECIEKYQQQKIEAIQNNMPLPKIPEYFGEAIIQIATRFSRRPNFIGYSFRDEMISDAIEHALVAADKFDPNKSSNPFSYITTMVYYSFIRRIAKEKRQSYIRSKLIQNMPIDSFDIQDHDDDTDFMNNYMAFIQSHQNFDDTQEKKVPKQKVVQSGPLEEFLEDYQSELIDNLLEIDLEKIALELEKDDVNESM